MWGSWCHCGEGRDGFSGSLDKWFWLLVNNLSDVLMVWPGVGKQVVGGWWLWWRSVQLSAGNVNLLAVACQRFWWCPTTASQAWPEPHTAIWCHFSEPSGAWLPWCSAKRDGKIRFDDSSKLLYYKMGHYASRQSVIGRACSVRRGYSHRAATGSRSTQHNK